MRVTIIDLVKRGSALACLALLAFAPAAGSARAPAQAECTGPASPVKLHVNISEVRSAQGLIAVTLYADDQKKFLAKKGSLYVGRVPASAPDARVCIHVPKTGVYAVAIYHDADSNRKFNRNALGMPAEGFGFSNNPPALFGLPSFQKVRIQVPRDGTEIGIRMRYP